MPSIVNERLVTCSYHCERKLHNSSVYKKSKRKLMGNQLAHKIGLRLIRSTKFSVFRFIQETEDLDYIHIINDEDNREMHVLLKFNKKTVY